MRLRDRPVQNQLRMSDTKFQDVGKTQSLLLANTACFDVVYKQGNRVLIDKDGDPCKCEEREGKSGKVDKDGEPCKCKPPTSTAVVRSSSPAKPQICDACSLWPASIVGDEDAGLR